MPDYLEKAKKEGVSVEQGFNVCLLFYHFLWPTLELKTLELAEGASTAHMLFFVDVCMGFESSSEWNDAIFRIKKIPKDEQRFGARRHISRNVFRDQYEEDWVVTGKDVSSLFYLAAPKGLTLSVEDLLLCTIEFCRIYNEIFHGDLAFILNIVEDMKARAENYPFEWSMWEKAIIDSYTIYVVRNFDWSSEPYRKS